VKSCEDENGRLSKTRLGLAKNINVQNGGRNTDLLDCDEANGMLDLCSIHETQSKKAIRVSRSVHPPSDRLRKSKRGRAHLFRLDNRKVQAMSMLKQEKSQLLEGRVKSTASEWLHEDGFRPEPVARRPVSSKAQKFAQNRSAQDSWQVKLGQDQQFHHVSLKQSNSWMQ
jgi:hypothetical protein